MVQRQLKFSQGRHDRTPAIAGSGSCTSRRPGVRGRTDHKSHCRRQEDTEGWLAALGRRRLRVDIDADLRVALLAIRGGGDRRLAVDFLRQSGDKKMDSIAMIELTSDAAAPLARCYADLRSETAKAVLRAESEAIRAMADSLPRNLAGKPKPNKRSAETEKTV